MMYSIVKMVVASIIVVSVNITPAVTMENVETRQIKGSFEDVYFDLKNAIINKGLVIDTVLYVADMLERTGKDVGSTKPIYLKGQTFGFCSAKLSRATMEADPNNLAFCPYTIFIYEAADTPNTITVGYRKLSGGTNPQSKKSHAAVNDFLGSIVKEVTSE